MTLRVQETAHDHIPEEFTIEGLKEGGLTDQEIEALTTGDDPILEAPKEPGEKVSEEEAELGATHEDAEDAEQATEPEVAAETPVVEDVKDPEIPQIPDVSAHEAKIEQIDESLNTLLDRYNDGDLTNSEYLQQQKALVAEQAAAQAAISQAEGSVQKAAEIAQQHWYERLDVYKSSAPELWSNEHINGWDRHLRAVTANDAYADLSRDAQIKMAHKLYGAEYEARTGKSIFETSTATETEHQQQAETSGEKMKARTDKRPEAPQTLAGYNSDTSAEVEDSTFASVDRTIMKDPLLAEKMFENMTDEQRDRYLTEV